MARQKINFKDIPTVIGGDLERVFRGSVFELYSRIVYSTPTGKPEIWSRPAPEGYVAGRLRGSWHVQIGGGRTDRDVIDEDGSSTIAHGLQQLSGYKVGMKARISNTTSYVNRIEFDGHSTQAPAGMARINIADWPQIVSDISKAQKARR